MCPFGVVQVCGLIRPHHQPLLMFLPISSSQRDLTGTCEHALELASEFVGCLIAERPPALGVIGLLIPDLLLISVLCTAEPHY